MRKLLPWTGALTILVAIWSGWSIYSRYSVVKNAERESQQRAKEREANIDRLTVAQFGGDKLTILRFSFDPGEVPRGGKSLMCYGVSNATTLKIEPDIE